MFGYVTIDKEKISEQQYTCYKAIYCSLCKTMGKEYSVFSRFILSYDATFYTMLILSLQDDFSNFKEGRCSFNPFLKCNLCGEEKALSLAAAFSISSAYYKIIDNINDSSFIKKIGYLIVKPVFKHWNKKVILYYPEIDSLLSKMIFDQSMVEMKKHPNLDEACEPTANMLSELCSLIPSQVCSSKLKDKDKSVRILKTFGYHLGRWIYLMDATDDYETDLKHKLFNPLIDKFINGFDKEYILHTLNHSLSEVLLSYNLLYKGRFDNIINNILYYGLPMNQQRVISKFGE